MIIVTTLSSQDYDAVLFDLDGVLTKTARVHAVAWKKLFDDFLEQRATKAGKAFVPFDIDADYPLYVDGKLRYDGVAAFLESRGIELPLGATGDGADVQSVHALGNLKNRYFLEYLKHDGVETYEAAIALVRKLRTLPAAQKEVIDLAFFKGMSQREIASKKQIALGTVKTRLHLALRKLHNYLFPMQRKI